MDTQSIRAPNHVPAATTGKDAGKRGGQDAGLAVDALGLIIAVVVTAASVTDNAIGTKLLDIVAAHTPTATVTWADAGFKQDVGVHGAVLDIDVEAVRRSDTLPGLVPVKKRQIVGQVYGTLMLRRRLAREYESRPESSVSRTLWASMANLVRRLTGTSNSTWRHGERPADTPRHHPRPDRRTRVHRDCDRRPDPRADRPPEHRTHPPSKYRKGDHKY